jgi:hypothetical protein
MSNDIRVVTSFKGHRKRRKLQMLLAKQPSATDFLLDLWIATSENHPNGVLSGMSDLDIALEAGWEGNPSEFVKALVEAGFLEKNGDTTYRLHDWEEHQPWVFHARERSDRARQAARVRWGNDKDADSMLDRCDLHADRNAPSPTPNPSPSPSPREGKASRVYISPPLGEFKNVDITEDELKKLEWKFGEQGTRERIEELSESLASKGGKYKSHYATILSWQRRKDSYGASGHSRGSARKTDGKKGGRGEHFSHKTYKSTPFDQVPWNPKENLS